MWTLTLTVQYGQLRSHCLQSEQTHKHRHGLHSPPVHQQPHSCELFPVYRFFRLVVFYTRWGQTMQTVLGIAPQQQHVVPFLLLACVTRWFHCSASLSVLVRDSD